MVYPEEGKGSQINSYSDKNREINGIKEYPPLPPSSPYGSIKDADEAAVERDTSGGSLSFQDQQSQDCYNLDYPEETGEDLELTLAEEKRIVVTVWLENYQNKWGQNVLNQDVQGTLWRIICQHHPNVVYTQADLSHYNRNAYTYLGR